MTLAKVHPASTNTMKLVAMLLFAVGICIFVFAGIHYKIEGKMVEQGPIPVTGHRSNSVALLPMLGGVALFGGGILSRVSEGRKGTRS